MANILLVVNGSKSYLSLAKDDFLKNINASASAKVVDSLSHAGVEDMFGIAAPAVIYLNDKSSVDRLEEELKAFSEEKAAKRFKSGLILLCSYAIASTKKLQAAVSALGGEINAKTKEQSKNIADELLVGFSISREVRDFLAEWAGEEPEKLIGITRFLSTLSTEKQKKVTLEIIAMQLSQEAGTKASWDIEKPLLSGNAEAAIEIYRRTFGGIGVVRMLISKIDTLYKAAFIQSLEPQISNDRLSAILNLRGRAINYIKPTSKRYGVEKLEKILNILTSLHGELMVGVSNSDARFEVAIWKICELTSR